MLAWPWLLAWVGLSLAGTLVLAQLEIRRQQTAFEVDARIAHRLLSQRAVEHEAILAMLALLQPDAVSREPAQRLSALFPQILRVERREPEQPWPAPLDALLAPAERRSDELGHATAAGFEQGRFWLVLSAEPASYALKIDLQAMIPKPDWPASLSQDTRVRLDWNGQTHELHSATLEADLRRFGFSKQLAADSQTFDLQLARGFGWSDLPWRDILLWTLATAVVLSLLARLRTQVRARRRAEQLLRLGQQTRLNALGELAAGLAHELNQPLTAVMANTQAARRLLDDQPLDRDTLDEALTQAAAQSRRAAEVLARLRRTVEQPRGGQPARRLALLDFARRTLDLLEPECRSRQVRWELVGDDSIDAVADPVALEQILHNLVNNALQALEQVPTDRRQLRLSVSGTHSQVLIQVEDSGPGIPADALARLFEPFFTTREAGLGLGLSLSETLASSMGGRLSAANSPTGGAVFTLQLPRAGTA